MSISLASSLIFCPETRYVCVTVNVNIYFFYACYGLCSLYVALCICCASPPGNTGDDRYVEQKSKEQDFRGEQAGVSR